VPSNCATPIVTVATTPVTNVAAADSCGAGVGITNSELKLQNKQTKQTTVIIAQANIIILLLSLLLFGTSHRHAATSTMSDPANINHYDSRAYTRKGATQRVVVREKPLLKSRMQRLADYLRPTTRHGFSVVYTFELAKVMACIIFPVFMLLYWKRVQKSLPDSWEQQFGGLQHRQFREDQLPEQDTDYFSIMENFQERREAALRKKQKEVVDNKIV
jgi:hypothetical protein